MTELMDRLENKASMAAAPDSEATLGEVMSAFEEFKRTNDGRLKELEKRGSTDALTEDKLARLNQALDGAKAAMDRSFKTGRSTLRSSPAHMSITHLRTVQYSRNSIG